MSCIVLTLLTEMDNFLAKTVSSIDIGINPKDIINQKKLLLNLGYIFPNKEYDSI